MPNRPALGAPTDGEPNTAALSARAMVTSCNDWESPQGDMDRLMEERIARNDATFRDANERISAAAGVYGVDMPVPFICECADPTCSEIVRLELDRYEEVRADSRHFLNVPGHHSAAQGAAVVVAERDGYVIVEKIGHAGNIVEALDQRNPDEGLDQLAASDE